MKRKSDVLSLLFVAILGSAILFAGCASVAPVRIVPTEGMPHYAPTDAASVIVLRSEPSRPFENLGQVVLDPGDTLPVPEMEQKLRQAAATLGANAVYIASDMTTLKGPIFAYAIRYKD
jgi:uncharacterized lipoprotein YajG